jgi:DNA-cytosine methyltransferase
VTSIELFSCSGGMAEGFRRAGHVFDWIFDYDKDAVDSYEKNLGHRPVQMDVHDLLRMVKGGWSPPGQLDLIVADPPCSPYSRAGKRKGTEDARDMLPETCEIIRLLRPRAYLIGNVPGLQDATQWSTVQEFIGGLSKHGYCTRDYAQLDAANYGVPQHRIRPFWYGHRAGPCIRWPARTHSDPDELMTGALFGDPLKPWVTCRDALSHLPQKELGRPVRVKWRDENPQGQHDVNSPARTITAARRGAGDLLGNNKHPHNQLDKPAFTVRGTPSAPRRSCRASPSRGCLRARRRRAGGECSEWPCRPRSPRPWRAR